MFNSVSQKNQHRLKIGLFFIAFVLLVMGISWGINQIQKKKHDEQASQPQSKKRMSLLTDKVEKDLWVAAEGQNIKALEKANEDMQIKHDSLVKEIDDLKKALKKNNAGDVKPVQKTLPPPFPSAPLPQPNADLNKAAPPMPNPVATKQEHQKPSAAKKQESEEPKKTPPDGIRIFESSKVETADQDKKKPVVLKEPTVWLPSGSFMKARIVNGIDAPTSGGAQAEPYPVLMTIADVSFLPNNFRMNLSECFVIGAGYANISDERAYIKTERLSCVRKDGQAIDIPLKGHVVGEDGKLGMRGKVVSKQGQQIAMAIFSGTLGGIGKALQPQQAMSLNLNPSGSSGFAPINMGETLESGVTGGVGNALSKVADHYLKMAEKIFPIVEIDAGRKVEILVLIGQELALKTTSKKIEGNISNKTIKNKER